MMALAWGFLAGALFTRACDWYAQRMPSAPCLVCKGRKRLLVRGGTNFESAPCWNCDGTGNASSTSGSGGTVKP